MISDLNALDIGFREGRVVPLEEPSFNMEQLYHFSRSDGFFAAVKMSRKMQIL